MKRHTTIITIGAGVAVLAVGIGAAVTATGGGDDEELPIRGDALDKAGAAALAHTGGGRVTDTEVGDEDSLYEVEVTMEDGRQIDVQLDENFDVVGDEVDGVGEDD